jgi:pimeloyl-ACP methyl ester carboxylesterase
LAPVQSDVPALLLSGEVDPVTPPENGELALKTLPNGRHLVLTGQGHISILRGCVPLLARDFIEAGSASELNTTCLNRLAPLEFFVNFNGPVP